MSQHDAHCGLGVSKNTGDCDGSISAAGSVASFDPVGNLLKSSTVTIPGVRILPDPGLAQGTDTKGRTSVAGRSPAGQQQASICYQPAVTGGMQAPKHEIVSDVMGTCPGLPHCSLPHSS